MEEVLLALPFLTGPREHHTAGIIESPVVIGPQDRCPLLVSCNWVNRKALVVDGPCQHGIQIQVIGCCVLAEYLEGSASLQSYYQLALTSHQYRLLVSLAVELLFSSNTSRLGFDRRCTPYRPAEAVSFVGELSICRTKPACRTCFNIKSIA